MFDWEADSILFRKDEKLFRGRGERGRSQSSGARALPLDKTLEPDNSKSDSAWKHFPSGGGMEI
jgi:hypothetical protein